MSTPDRHFRFDLGYDGTAFFGSQRQLEARTVQQVVEEALSRLTGRPVTLAFAGRTDRGVHAVDQVASGTIRWRKDAEALRFALDATTPDDVSVVDVREVNSEFHARFSARQREYRYRVWNAKVPATILRRFVWHVRSELNVDDLNRAAATMVGLHDFSSLAGAGLGLPESKVDCTRTVTLARWSVEPIMWEPAPIDGCLLEFRVRADRFLPHMVRNMVGNMVEVGCGARSVEWFESMFAASDRTVARPPAPATGLVLWSVEYP